MVLLLPSHTSSFSSDITYPGEQIEMGTSVPIGKLPEDGHGDGQVQDAWKEYTAFRNVSSFK